MSDRPAYILPVKWADDDGRLAGLSRYLRWLSRRCDVIVVDGSPPDEFDRHHRAWGEHVLHCAPDADLRCSNGKAWGVLSGMRRATAELVIIADDDVRYDDTTLRAVIAALLHADLVIPQNVFRPLPWHARWDTARSLVNRALTTDYPGTLAVRRSAFDRAGGYDGDVLFENLELMRSLRASGATTMRASSLFVERRPPTARTFWTQRTRQAYDSLAQPGRLLVELAVLPVLAGLARHDLRLLLLPTAAVAALAEAGRRRAHGRGAYPRSAALWGPVWVLERGICSWIALGCRVLKGGIRYAGVRITVAAHRQSELNRRYRRRRAAAGSNRRYGIRRPRGARRRTA